MFTLRRGTANEINQYNSFCVDNVGETIEVAENAQGQIVGYMMRTGSTIYYIESDAAGVGSFLVDSIKERFEYAAADNVQKTAEGFWAAMNFQPEGDQWTWYEGE